MHSWKVSKYGIFSGPYFPAFRLNTEIYEVNSVFSPNTGKYIPEKTPYLNTFHAVMVYQISLVSQIPHMVWRWNLRQINFLISDGEGKNCTFKGEKPFLLVLVEPKNIASTQTPKSRALSCVRYLNSSLKQIMILLTAEQLKSCLKVLIFSIRLGKVFRVTKKRGC